MPHNCVPVITVTRRALTFALKLVAVNFTTQYRDGRRLRTAITPLNSGTLKLILAADTSKTKSLFW